MGIVCCNRVDVETEIWQEEESMRKKKMRKEQAAGVSLSALQGLYGSTDNNIITNASFFFPLLSAVEDMPLLKEGLGTNDGMITKISYRTQHGEWKEPVWT